MNQYAIPTMCSNLLYLDERGQDLLIILLKLRNEYKGEA